MGYGHGRGLCQEWGWPPYGNAQLVRSALSGARDIAIKLHLSFMNRVAWEGGGRLACSKIQLLENLIF